MIEQATSIYLDNNATTMLAPECVVPVFECLCGNYGNPSSKHGAGARARERM